VSEALERACRLLLRPDLPALECSLEELVEARRYAETLIARAERLSVTGGSLPVEGLARLSRGLLRARALLDQGAGFWEGWTRCRNALTDGYGAGGGPVQPPVRGALSLEA